MPSKEHKIGNTTIIVYSALTAMTPEERLQWFNTEIENNNQVLSQIARAIENCYK